MGAIITQRVHGAYSVEIRSDMTYFTVYRDGKPAGTIRRPHRGDRHWSAWSLEARFLGNAIGPRTALANFTRRDRDNFVTSDYGTED